MAVSSGFGEDVGFEGIDQSFSEDVGLAGLDQSPSVEDTFGTGDPGETDVQADVGPGSVARGGAGVNPAEGFAGDPAELAALGGYRGPEQEVADPQFGGDIGDGRGGRETLSFMEAVRQNGFFNTLFGHLPGVVPGFNVVDYKATLNDPQSWGSYQPPASKTEFSGLRAIADVAGLAFNVPSALTDVALDFMEDLDPRKQVADADDFTTSGAEYASYGVPRDTPAFTPTEGDGEVAPYVAPKVLPIAPVVPPTAPTPATALFAGVNPSLRQNVRGLVPRSSFAAGGFVTATDPSPTDNLVTVATNQATASPHPGVLAQGLPGGQLLNPSFRGGGVVRRPSYANGGPVGVAPAGVVPPGAAPSGAAPGGLPAQGMEQELQRLMQQHPEQIAQIKQAVTQALQTGELTPQELNMSVQLATAAAQNPQLYPQLKQFAEQQGLADPGDLPEQYDEGLVFAILLASKAAQAGGVPQAAGQPPVAPGVPQANAQAPQTTLRIGGPVPNSRNADGSVAINAHEGEGMLHKGVMLAKGRDFLDKLNGAYELDGSAKQKA